jgi:hypothetical protein
VSDKLEGRFVWEPGDIEQLSAEDLKKVAKLLVESDQPPSHKDDT